MNVQSLVARLRRKVFAQAAARTRARRAVTRLRFQELETREVPAVIPAPVIDNTSFRAIDNNGFAPSTAIDPSNPNRLIMADVRTMAVLSPTDTRTGFRYTTNGGTTWTNIGTRPNSIDPKTGTAFLPYTQVSNPSVAFDRFGMAYVTFTEHNDDHTSGRLLLIRINFAGGNPVVGSAQVLYNWWDSSKAFNPNVAVDTNLGTFQDPDVAGAAGRQDDFLAAQQTAQGRVRVFVTWNAEVTTPDLSNSIPDQEVIANSYVIFERYSEDGGATFSAPVMVNDSGYTPGIDGYVFSKTAFTPGRAGQSNSGGRMATLFTANQPNEPIQVDTVLFNAANGAPENFERTAGPVLLADATDPGNGAPHIPGVSDFNFQLTAAENITAIENISVQIQLTHTDLSQLRIELISPNPAIKAVLVSNGIDTAGNATGGGITGGQLGDVVPTTFTDEALWRITNVNPNAVVPFRGYFRPEGGSLMAIFGSLPSASIIGTWKVRITDMRAGSTGIVNSVALRIGQNMPENGLGVDRGTNAITPAANFWGTNHPIKPGYAPTSGVGPGLSVAVDNTLGAFSPYQNRMYMTYWQWDPNLLTSTIRLRYSDNGGQAWSTPATTIGSGFMPEVTVDPTTGTVIVAYYSATQFDAAGLRSTTLVRTSITAPDFNPTGALSLYGPLELSAPSFVNPREQAYDQIRSKVLDSEPIPSNNLVAGPEMFGNGFGLTAFDGRVNVVYSGNLNIDNTHLISPDVPTANGAQVRTQNMKITAGPRVIDGDMGPILGEGRVAGVSGTVVYNDVDTDPTSDGRDPFTGFEIEFDRIVDPGSILLSDIQVIYRSPTDDPAGPGTVIPVLSVTALDDLRDPVDNSQYGSKRYLIRVAPQSAVGTYSYLIGSNSATVGSNIHDRIRGQKFVYVPSGTPQTFTRNGPVAIEDFDGAFHPQTTTVTVGAGAFPANTLIGDVNVLVSINHPNVADLRLELIAPSGQAILLAAPGDANLGANYVNTVFDDDVSQTLADDVPPYTGSFKPAQPLTALAAGSIFGVWGLRITDESQGDNGTMIQWRLTVGGIIGALATSTANFIDQNANGVENDLGTDGPDAFAIPAPDRTIGGQPFQLPYQAESLPIVIAGPRVVGSRAPGQPQTSDNLVKDTTTKSIDVQFDRTMSTPSFTSADVLRIIGPLGDIPLTGVKVTPITALDGAVTTGNSKFYRIEFAQQKLSGTYTVQLSSKIADTDGNEMDTNTNAGVGNLVGAITGASVTLKTYGGDVISQIIPAKTTITVNLNVPDAFLIQRLTTNLSITHANTRDLEARLEGPDGTKVLLFIDAPQSGNAVDFVDTTFDDAATTPVQLGGSHFAHASFNPVQPLAQFISHGSKGLWKLFITNKGDLEGTVTKFGISMDKPVVGTGLGEEVADQSVVSTRIFQTDGVTDTAKGNWTAIGPSPQVPFSPPADPADPRDGNTAGSTAGRVTGIAVDPSDPSGNTVYAAGASGGVWRTTNFMTRDVNGPTWAPLTDFGPNNAINVGSVAVYNTTGDPNKTFILVGTGSQDLNEVAKSDYKRSPGDPNTAGTQEQHFDGVGFLLSEDAGKTWRVLDSTINFDSTTQSYRPITDPTRDHLFVGADVNKLQFETKVDVFSNRPIIYAAVSQGASAASTAGLWRSRDGGRTWTKIELPAAGDVTDFLYGQGSQLANSLDRPTYGYVAIRGQGVYFSSNLDSDQPSFLLMGGGVGRPTVLAGGVPVPVDAPTDTPNGAKGRIVLAAPFLDQSALANIYYKEWLYAAVARPDGTFDGLYLTKDRGYNWTKVGLTRSGGFSDLLNDVDPTFWQGYPGGNHSLALAVDPNDPNIVYLGSDGLLKIDTTFMDDPYNLTMYEHSNADDGGAMRPDTIGAVEDDNIPNTQIGGGLSAFDINFTPPLASSTPNTASYEAALDAGIRRKKWNHLNLARDPYNQFRTDTTLFVITTPDGPTVTRFTNTGGDVTWGFPGGAFAQTIDVRRPPNGPAPNGDFDYISQIVTFQDPLTGKARLIYGHDDGIATYVPNSDGSNQQINGFTQDRQIAGDPVARADLQTTSIRNGNLQVARFYSGDVQPSLLAAGISQSLAYGAARRLNDVVASTENVLGSGEVTWGFDGRGARANYVAADQLGKGNVYILRRINDLPHQLFPVPPLPQQFRTDFFQVSTNGNAPISMTEGLFQSTADALGQGQWNNLVRVFAVNPVDADGLIMGSSAGRLFRTVNQGKNWNAIAEPGTLDGSYLTALSFGAPDPLDTSLNDLIYVGSEKGDIFATKVGGGNLIGSWTKITGGSFGALDGSDIMKIVPNPNRGSHELFAVTQHGVFHMADWTAPGALWVDITTNLLALTTAGFGNAGWISPILSTSDPISSLAVDWRPTYGQTSGNPILYVGGDGGVFRAIANDDTTIWDRFTGPNDKSSSPGGGMPVVKVTDLDLALGNIDKNTGRVIPAGTPDALVATTLGRGTWEISIGVPPGFSGPRVIASSPTTPQFTPISSVTITFDSFIKVSSFTTADVTIIGPNGQSITPTAVVDITPPSSQNLHNIWRIDFPAFAADGTYTITVGPNILSGNAAMNQDGDGINGEPIQDQFVMKVVIGLNDLADYVKDSFQLLLGRLPSTAEFSATTITNMAKARLAALGVTVKELLSTANGSEARQRLVERLFNNGAAAGEIGNLLPTYAFSTAERDFYVTALKNGTKSPESIAIDLIATTDATKGFKDKYFQTAGGNATAFLNQLYADIYKGSGVLFSWVLGTTKTTQTNQAATATGRLNLTRSLINGLVVKYYPGGNTSLPLQSLDFRTNFIQLAYQKYLGRAATASEVTAGKSLMARLLAANSIQGSEWLYWKLLSSQEYFDRAAVQSETPALPDDGLHTQRGWVESVFKDRFYRTAVGGHFSTSGERDTYSQKVLVGFKAQRQAFINSIVLSSVGLGLEYRDLKIKEYYQLVHARNPNDTERIAAETALKNGSTFPGLIAAQFATSEFYSTNAPQFAGGAPSPTTFARAVYLRLFNRLPTAAEESNLASKAGTVSSRQTAVLAILNGVPYRDVLITADFQLFLGRNPSTNELSAYQTFLKTHRWELLITDLLANGAASAAVTAGLPREFWEVRN
jgi:large repetitive protein